MIPILTVISCLYGWSYLLYSTHKPLPGFNKYQVSKGRNVVRAWQSDAELVVLLREIILHFNEKDK